MTSNNKHLNLVLWILGLGLGLGLSLGCQKNSDTHSYSIGNKNFNSSNLNPINTDELTTQTTITVTNLKGEALAGAQVLIGMSANDPFENNFVRTNINGQAIIDNNQWTNQPVTINYPGYNRVTFYGVNPGQHTYQLRPVVYSGKYELKGRTTDFGKLVSRDDKADFGLVIQSLTRNDLFSFDLGMIVSKEQDTLSVAGYSVRIPSNVSLPRQVESYFIDLTIDKPSYRTYFEMPGTKKMYALRGQFPFNRIVNEFRNNTPFQALINQFNFLGGSIRDVEITSNHQMDIPVNEIVFGNPIKVKLSPSMTQTMNQKTLLTITANEKDGYIFPSDLKKFDNPNGTMNLKTSELGSKYVIAILKRSEDFYATKAKQAAIALSMKPILANSKEIEINQQLDLIAQPEGNLDGWMQNTIMSKLPGVEPIGTYAKLTRHQNFGSNVENVNVLWEAYAPIWVLGMKLPIWPTDNGFSNMSGNSEYSDNSDYSSSEFEIDTAVSEYHRWEVTYIGSDVIPEGNNNRSSPLSLPVVPLGPQLADYATHISYNNKDF